MYMCVHVCPVHTCIHVNVHVQYSQVLYTVMGSEVCVRLSISGMCV